MAKKWYNLFVSVDEKAGEGAGAPGGGVSANPAQTPGGQPTAAQTVAELAAGIQAPPAMAPVADPTSFNQIYDAAEIVQPAHGFTIFKIAEMMQSEHIRSLPMEVKRSSILLALDAAGVKIVDIIQDAVRRDTALDTYERVQQKALEELEARKADDNARLQAEMEKMVADYTARIQANRDETGREKERIYGWMLKKRQEEQRIAEAVAPFVSENPITRSQPSPGATTPGGGTTPPAAAGGASSPRS